ncbi:MAG: GIY-YIG nuclease family protein [Patescibacteria group bacterium]
MFSYVYILRSLSDRKYYVGCTNNLSNRLREHNSGKSFSTKPRLPFVLIYYEAFPDREDAERREQFFKTGWGRNYLRRALRRYLLSEKI